LLRALLTSAAIFIAAFVVYGSNGDQYVYSYDSAPNSLLAFNLIEHHRLDFDDFAGGYFDGLGAGYIFARTPGGHEQSIFPVGVAILSAPLYLTFAAVARLRHEPLPITSIAFERQRLHDEKTAASVLAAIAAVLMFWCVRELSSVVVAVVLTIVFAFGTSMWTIGSQALWQHGSVNLLVVALTWALVRAARRGDRAPPIVFALAGLAAGLLPVVRPTALLFSLAAFVWLLRTQRRGGAVFAAAFLIGAAPGAWWNLVNFHTLIGGYTGDAEQYALSAGAARAWLALAVSPSKGLIWYLPFVVLAPVGAVIAVRSARAGEALLAWLGGAGLALAATYGFYAQWWGGASFGPRFLTDLDAIVVLLLVPIAIAAGPALRARRPAAIGGAIVFGLVAVYAIGVQAAGANGESNAEWSAIPSSVDTHLDRMWDPADTQIARDLQFARERWQPGPAGTAAYAASFAARVDVPAGDDRLATTPGAPIDVAVAVHDTGSVPLYGYTTGVWAGQTRVRTSYGMLYLRGAVAPGSTGMAGGTLIAPPVAGTYRVDCTVIPYRWAGPSPPATRCLTLVVRASG
jgi:hypothetical protein